jgi:hypothetical protein
VDARQRKLEAEALENELLEQLESVRARYRSSAGRINPAEYDRDVGGAL